VAEVSPAVEERLARLDSGFYCRADVQAMMRMFRAMERLAQSRDLQTTVGNSVERLIKPSEIMNTMEEALK
jgi:hypothetical protein